MNETGSTLSFYTTDHFGAGGIFFLTMKKYFFLLFVMLLYMPTFAQSHLNFEGIPITGQVDNFVTKLNAKGYERTDETREFVYMKGTFMDKEVKLTVVYTPVTKTVWKVLVEFGVESSWSSLKESYFRYKDIYARKYGEPLSVECFSGEYYDGHGYELEALSYGECSYTSSYDTLNGLIRVEMFDSGCIWIHYIDNAGAALMNNEASYDE